MIYPTYYLLARLNLLQLVGYEDGKYQFMGTEDDFSAIDREEDKILFPEDHRRKMIIERNQEEGDRQDTNPNYND